MTYLDQEEMNQRVNRFWDTRLGEILALIKEFPNLRYIPMGNKTHHRIMNDKAGKFIDFWQTGTMRDMNGKFYGMGFKNSNISREIRKLGLYECK